MANIMRQNIDRIIARHLGGSATPAEQRRLQEWLAESERRRALFAALVSDVKPDTESAWAAFERHTQKSSASSASSAAASTPPSPCAAGRRLAPSLIRYAAAVALLMGITTLAWVRLGNGNDNGDGDGGGDGDGAQQIWLIAESSGEAQGYTLSDSSGVFLNRGSKLSCIGDYGSGKRELLLEGEAFFDVAATGSGLLVVRAGQTLIRDVGTAFNVQAYAEDSSVTVFVQSGEVHFYTETHGGITLRAGETGTFDRRTQTFVRNPTDDNATAYMTRIFVFKDRPLSEAAALIGKVYGVRICVSDSATAAQAISVTFDGEELDEILEVISETMSLQATLSGDAYLLLPQLANSKQENAER